MSAKSAFKELLAIALAYPGAHEDHPWGHTVVKVKGKIFAYIQPDDAPYFGAKLPQSQGAALVFPWAEPMGYGMAKSGWISANFKASDDVPMPLLKEWLEESYRAVAPKTLVKEFDAGKGAAAEPVKKAAAKKPPAKKKAVPEKAVAKKSAAKKVPAKKR